MPILALLPALWEIFEKIGIPLLAESKSSLVGAVVSGKWDGTAESLVNIATGLVGNVTDIQKLELKGQIQTLIGQQQLQAIDAESPSFFRSGCRDTLEWGLSIIVLVHLSIVEIANIHALLTGGTLQPLDTLTTILLTGLLGIYATTKTIEKYTSNDS